MLNQTAQNLSNPGIHHLIPIKLILFIHKPEKRITIFLLCLNT